MSDTSSAAAPRSLPPVARRVDDEMARLAASFDWLKAVSPLATAVLWDEFRAGGCREAPRFRYPDPGIDVGRTRERLLGLPVRDIEDPVYAALLAEKQRELDRHLELIELRATEGFMQVSIDLFGAAAPELYAEALHILEAVPADAAPRGECVALAEVLAAAGRHFDHYRATCPDFAAELEISDDITAGLMVSRDRLIVCSSARIPRERLDALLHHEIGTHIVTYHNGSHQPLKQLRSGLAHYDELQEGLGVLAEYLSGNLPPLRLRTLAARVVAVRRLTEGAGFADVYRELESRHGFSPHAAFVIVTRVFRGGGLTKDVVYLRGLRALVEYLREGHDFDRLFVGKFSLDELPAIERLRRRRQLAPPALLPSYLHNAQAFERLAACVDLPLDRLCQELVA